MVSKLSALSKRCAFLARLAQVRMTLAYAFVVTCVSTALLCLGPAVQGRVISHASTNLHNLSHGCVGTLLGSAFVVDAGPIYVWLPGLICLLALAELLWRSGRLVVAFVLGHIGATLLVAAGLTTAIELGWVPVSLSRATDVGISYGAAAVVGALTSAVPRRWRPAWIGWWLSVGATAIVVSHHFTEVGHAVALVLGMAVSTRFGRPARWTPPLLMLLGVGAAFAYLMMSGTGPTLAVGVGSGLLGAAAVHALVRRRGPAMVPLG